MPIQFANSLCNGILIIKADSDQQIRSERCEALSLDTSYTGALFATLSRSAVPSLKEVAVVVVVVVNMELSRELPSARSGQFASCLNFTS